MSDRNYVPPSGLSYTVKKTAGQKHCVDSGKGEAATIHVNLEQIRIDYQTQRILWNKSEHERKMFWVFESRGKRVLSWPGGSMELESTDLTEGTGAGSGRLKPLKLTMPGKVVAVHVKEGQIVEAEQNLLVVEAMKMENLLLAPSRAKIAKIHVAAGDRLESGSLLITFEAAD